MVSTMLFLLLVGAAVGFIITGVELILQNPGASAEPVAIMSKADYPWESVLQHFKEADAPFFLKIEGGERAMSGQAFAKAERLGFDAPVFSQEGQLLFLSTRDGAAASVLEGLAGAEGCVMTSGLEPCIKSSHSSPRLGENFA